MFVQAHRRYEILQRYSPSIARLYKLADVDDKTFEQALSNIAHAYIQDRIPELLPYALGFQLIEKSEDDNRAVGVFGFKIGKIFLYIPVFFINGTIRGIDLLYVYNLRKFVPANSKYVDRIKRLQHIALGEPSTAVTSTRYTTFPNLMQLKPQTMKWASNQPTWLRPFVDVLLEGKFTPNSVNFPSYAYDEILTKSASSAHWLIDTLYAYPKLTVQLYDCYGKTLHNLVKLAGQTIQQYPEEFKTSRKDFKGKTVPHADLDRSGQDYRVEIYFFIDEEAPQHLSQQEVQKLIERGYLVRDRRKNHSKAVIIDSQENEKKLYGAVQPGWRNLVLLSGELCPGFVVPIVNSIATSQKVPQTIELKRGDRRIQRHYFVLPCPEDKKKPVGFILSQSQIVIAPEDPDPESIPRLQTVSTFRYEKPEPAQARKEYVIFTEDEATPPFTISGDVYDNELGVRTILGNSRRDQLDLDDPDQHGLSEFEINVRILVKPAAKRISVVKEFDGSSRYKRVTYIVPPDAWIAECAYDPPDSVHLMPAPMIPTTLSKYADDQLTIAKINESEFAINKKPIGANEALKKLIIDYGLSEQDTLALLKRASSGPVTVLIKRAADNLQPAGTPTAPSMPLPDVTISDLGQMGASQFRAPAFGYAQMQSDYPRDLPPATDPLNADSTVDKLLQTAIQSGQKEVLDTSVFASLLNAVEDRDIIERYLPDLINGLDALGRLLFNFYMHYEVFKDRYGEDELEALEQNVRNTFRMLGDVVLKLEQRPIISNESYKKVIGLSKD